MATPIILWEWYGRRTVVIESHRIEDCMDFYHANACDGVAINPVMGYESDRIDFLKSHRYVRGVWVISAKGIDISAIAEIERLEYLCYSGWSGPMDLRQRSELQQLSLTCHKGLLLAPAYESVRLLSLSKFGKHPLPNAPSVEELELHESRLFDARVVASRYSTAKRVSLAYVSDVIDLNILMESMPGLRSLELDRCARVTGYEAIAKAPELTRLIISGCAPCPSLTFLRECRSLKHLAIVDTDVQDGDLSPIESLEELQHLGITSKRHFSTTQRALRERLGLR